MKNQIQQHRILLDQILDQLIPANIEKNIPAAGSFGVGDFIAARAEEDKTVSDALERFLSSAANISKDVNPEIVKALEASDSENFALLLRLTYMGYYSRPEIRSLVGVGSWPVHPKGYEVPLEPADMIEKLTEPVRDRGAIYRYPGDEPQVSS